MRGRIARAAGTRREGSSFEPPASRRRTEGEEALEARRLARTEPDVPPSYNESQVFEG